MNLRNLLRLVFAKKSHRQPARRLQVEQLEDRCVPTTASSFRPIDEIGNNTAIKTLGTAGTALLRISPVAYADGISSPSLPNNPSARVLSDILNNQANADDPLEDIETLNGKSLSDYGYVWGQFIDHDMDLTTTRSGELLTILADPNDPVQMGDQTFVRSTFDGSTGTGTDNPRQQTNSVTAYLDLSQVYGSTALVADALRTHSGGKLKTSPGNMLPYNNSTYFTPAQLSLLQMANDTGVVASEKLFAAGDVRANENPELTALQTLFVRNHNRFARQLHSVHPLWGDEQLYQEARKLNIAEYQIIIYTEYLPALLGPNALPAYTGYSSSTDPTIATEFSTVAFRFGHSLLDGEIERHGNNSLDVPPNDPAGSSLSLAMTFFDPNVLNPKGAVDPFTGHISTDIDPILKGMADGVSNADDLLATNAVRNLLFGAGGQADNGLDLIARDVERARDHGIGTYNQVRRAYGLPPVTSFDQITSNVQVQQKLMEAYGSVDNIDPFEGGMAEDHVPGSDLGPLFTKILADQFTRLRDGDRFFYRNELFNQEELNILQHGNTLAKVIQANTNITNLQADVMYFHASISGAVLLAIPGGPRNRPPQGLPGLTVQLQDDGGNVLATTVTDSRGRYSFNQQTGVNATGLYTVSLVLPSGYVQISTNPPSFSISRGDSFVSGVNYLLQRTIAPPKVSAGSTNALPATDSSCSPMADSVNNWIFSQQPQGPSGGGCDGQA